MASTASGVEPIDEPFAAPETIANEFATESSSFRWKNWTIGTLKSFSATSLSSLSDNIMKSSSDTDMQTSADTSFDLNSLLEKPQPLINIISDSEEMSSVDSFPLTDSLTDSPGATSTSSNSHHGSSRSLTGILRSRVTDSHNKYAPSFKSHSRNNSSNFTFLLNGMKSAKSEYSVLQSQLSKFKSQHNPIKANTLRMTLLPFLRKNEEVLVPPAGDIELPLKVLAGWWDELLIVMKSNFKNVAGVDRNAFYEAVSAIMARPEWSDNHSKPAYQRLLSGTTVHILARCSSSAHLPVAQAAFTGKVVAYAFIYIPDFAIHVLSVLEVSSSSIQRLDTCKVSDTQSDTELKSKAMSVLGSPAFPALNHQHLSHLQQSLPVHLQQLIDIRKKLSVVELQQKLSWFNFDSCAGWNRYFGINTPFFASFFKHLCTLQSRALPLVNQSSNADYGDETRCFTLIGEDALLAAPGMRLVLASIVTHFDIILSDTTRTLGPRNANPYGYRLRQTPTQSKWPSSSNSSFPSTFSKMPMTSGNGSPPSERVRIDQLKVFSAMREVLHSDDTTGPYVLVFSRVFDRVIRASAVGVRVHDMDGCVTVCDFAEEWISSVFAVKATKSIPLLVTFKETAVDWNFWMKVAHKMLGSDNLHTEIRALSFLFNIWPHIPNIEPCDHSASKEPEPFDDGESSFFDARSRASTFLDYTPGGGKSILRSVTEWMLSEETWLQLFCHWSPLVRSYFHRLVCYRIASVGKDSGPWFLEVESAQYLDDSRELLQKRLMSTYFWCDILSANTQAKPETMPSLPMPRLRVGIRKVGPSPTPLGSSGKLETNGSRVFLFDIFDSAAYWQTDSETWKVEQDHVAIPQSMNCGKESSSAFSLGVGSLSRSSSIKTIASGKSVTNTGILADTINETPIDKYQDERSSPVLPSYSEGTSAPNSPDAKTTQWSIINGNVYNAKPSPRRSSLQKRWSHFCNIIGSKNKSKLSGSPVSQDGTLSDDFRLQTLLVTDPQSVELPSDSLSRSSSRKMQRKKSDKRATSGSSNDKFTNIVPAELTRPRPEIVRSPHRFVMISTNMRPPTMSQIAHPKLPFSRPIAMDVSEFDCNLRKQNRDLSVWNYGGRSLAEWNIEVVCFERFAKLQEKALQETLEMFTMPFLVAEIPWKASG